MLLRSDNYIAQASTSCVSIGHTGIVLVGPANCKFSALGYRPPAPDSIVTMDQRPTMH